MAKSRPRRMVAPPPVQAGSEPKYTAHYLAARDSERVIETRHIGATSLEAAIASAKFQLGHPLARKAVGFYLIDNTTREEVHRSYAED